MADEVANPKIVVDLDTSKAKAGLTDLAGSADKVGQALGSKLVEPVTRSERALAKLKDQLSGDSATSKLTLLEKAVNELGGVANITGPKLENLSKMVDRLKAAGGAVPASLSAATASLSKFESAVANLGKQELGSFASQFGPAGTALASIGPAGLAAAAGIGAFVAAGGGLAKISVEAVDYASHIADLSQRNKIGAETLQEMAASAAMAHADIGDLTKSLQNVDKAIINKPQLIRDLGLSLKTLSAADAPTKLLALASALDRIADPVERDVVSMELFGKKAAEINVILQGLREGVGEHAKALGAVMSGDMVAALDNVGDRATLLKITWDGLWHNIGASIASSPGVVSAIDSITEAIGRLSSKVQQQGVDAAIHPAIHQAIGYAAGIAAGGPAGALIAATTFGTGAYADAAEAELQLQETEAAQRAFEAKIRKQQEATRQAGTKGPVHVRTEAERAAEKEAAKEAERAHKAELDAADKVADYRHKKDIELADQRLKLAEQGYKDETAYQKALDDAHKETLDAADKHARELHEEDKKEAERRLADAIAYWKKQDELAKSSADTFTGAIAAAGGMFKGPASELLGDLSKTMGPLSSMIMSHVKDGTATGLETAVYDFLRGEGGRGLSAMAAGIPAVLQASASKSLLQAVSGSAMAGGQAGAALGPYGALAGAGIGAEFALGRNEDVRRRLGSVGTVGLSVLSPTFALGAITSLFDGHKQKDAAFEAVGQAWGVSISKGLTEKIAADAKRTKSLAAGTLLNLGDTIKEAGGIDKFGVENATVATAALFDELKNGKLTLDEVKTTFEGVFGDVAAANISKTTGLASQGLLDLVKAAQEFKLESPAVLAFLSGQASALGSNLSGGLGSLKASREKGGAGLANQGAASGISNAIVGDFGQMLASGAPQADALKAIAPAIASMREELEAAGLKGGAAFDALEQRVSIVSGEITGPLVSGIGSFAGALVNMHNLSMLTETDFAGITAQIGANIVALDAQGIKGPAAAQALAPDLQKIWELQKDTGYAVDQTTQALIDEAVKADLVGESHRSAADQMLSATKEMTQAVKDLTATLDGLDGKKVKVTIDMQRTGGGAPLAPQPGDPGYDPYAPEPLPQNAEGGLFRYRPGGTVGIFGEKEDEYAVPKSKVRDFAVSFAGIGSESARAGVSAASVFAGLAGNGAPGGEIHLHVTVPEIHVHDSVDPQKTAAALGIALRNGIMGPTRQLLEDLARSAR